MTELSGLAGGRMVLHIDVRQARRLSPLGKIPRGYYLAPSETIRDANNQRVRGLFTAHPLRKGQLIGEYRGPKVDETRTATKRRFTQYFFAVFDDDRQTKLKFVIDGANSRRSSFLRHVNAPNRRHQANARFVQKLDAILLYALKDIPPNTELLAWYGRETRRILKQR